MNSICLLGRLTADPELKTTPNGVEVTSFCVAVDRAYQPKGQERQTDFINVVAWRGTAVFITTYFHKGQRIALNGSLQSRQYTDKEGNKRTAYEVNAEHAFFAESKKEATNTGSTYSPLPGNPPSVQNDNQLTFANASVDNFEEIDDDLPF